MESRQLAASAGALRSRSAMIEDEARRVMIELV
jgi:hypothetical protein